MKVGPCDVYLACGTADDNGQGKENKRRKVSTGGNIHSSYNPFFLTDGKAVVHMYNSLPPLPIWYFLCPQPGPQLAGVLYPLRVI